MARNTTTSKQTRTSKAPTAAPEVQAPATAPADAAQVSAWAREKARALSGGSKAADRCVRLADALSAALEKGKGKPVTLRFAQCNELAGVQRGARGDAVRSWGTALSRMRTLYRDAGIALPFAARIDADSESIVVEPASAE